MCLADSTLSLRSQLVGIKETFPLALPRMALSSFFSSASAPYLFMSVILKLLVLGLLYTLKNY